MKKLLISLLALSLSCFAGQLNINYNTGTPTVIEFTDIASMEIVTTTPVPAGMVAVTCGTFNMGDPSYATPVHSVTLSSYYIGKYEVTQTEWVATMGTNPSYFTGDLNRPVEQVSWYDIMVYCNKRSIAESLTPCYTINGSTDPAVWGTVPTYYNTTWDAATCDWTAKGYRLPTEAEWEFAARGGNSSNGYTYSGSNTIGDVAWYNENSGYTTHAFGTKAPNELGIYDMSGNVWEWNWDWYESYTSSAQTDPHGATTGTDRVLRGGSCYYFGLSCRVANRINNYPFSDSYGSGFRLARTC